MERRVRVSWSGLGAGAVAGGLDVLLIAVADPAADGWVWVQSFLAWTVSGWAVVASESGLRGLPHGVVVTLFLNLPWFVAFSVAIGRPEHLPPLVAMSALFGLGFGWVHGRARRAR